MTLRELACFTRAMCVASPCRSPPWIRREVRTRGRVIVPAVIRIHVRRGRHVHRRRVQRRRRERRTDEDARPPTPAKAPSGTVIAAAVATAPSVPATVPAIRAVAVPSTAVAVPSTAAVPPVVGQRGRRGRDEHGAERERSNARSRTTSEPHVNISVAQRVCAAHDACSAHRSAFAMPLIAPRAFFCEPGRACPSTGRATL